MTGNTVEYRATLDPSGVKTGAAEAAAAIASITGKPAAESIKDLSVEVGRMGSSVQSASTQASEGLAKVSKGGLEVSTSQAQAATAAQQFLATLREQIAVSSKSADELLRYRAAQMGVSAEAAPLILQYQNQKAAQLAAAEAARIEEAAQREALAVKQRAASVQENFLSGLRDQAALQGKSATEVLQYRAAQLGVADSAAQYIKAIEGANNANKIGTISAGQHAAAMRMLPAQMTDVVTSVASGMPIWMVAIQQGGQIKDSFGGIGNAARAMLGTITPVTAAIGVLTGVGGLMAAAYYQGSAEVSGFTRALAMSGNAAGTNVTEMTAMARAAGDVIGSQHEAAAALTAMAGSGAVARENLQQFSVVASDLERYAGQPVKTTVEHMAKLGDAPVKASIALNEQYHYLTESVYRQIKALEDQGQKDEAAALAQRTYASAMAERAAQVKGNLGTLERGWDTLQLAARKAWDAMLNVGRAASLDDIRAKIDSTNRDLNNLLSGDGFDSNGGGAAFGSGARNRAARIDQLKKQLGDLQAQAAPLEAADAQAQIKAEQQATEDAKLAARQRTDALGKEVRSRADIRKQEIAQLNRDRETLAMGQQEYDKLLAGINEKYKDPKQAKGAGGVTMSDTQLATLRSQLTAAQEYHQLLQTLGVGASELNTAERESLKISEQLKLATNSKTIAKLQEAKATADALAVQLRSNDGLEKSLKAQQALIDGNFKDAQSIALRAKEQEAANEVFGKGRTAIQQMLLATMEHQLAEAESSDRFDPKFIASLKEKIAAQKDWVAALGKADYKAVMQHADELLRNAIELSATYEDELALSGLTALEREKIVAQRAVELRYAKELANLDQKSLTDDQRRAALAKLEEARSIESAAAVAKAQQNYTAKASEEINRSLTDALMRGFESGKDSAQNLADTVENMFNTMVLRPVISAVMAPASGVINGVVQSGLNAIGLGGGSNLMGMASNASSLYSLTTGNSLLNTAAGWLGLGGGGTVGATGLAASLGSGVALAGTSAGLGMTAGVGTGLGLVGGGGLGLTAGSAGAGAIGAGLGTSAAAGGAAAGGLSGALAAVPGWGWAAMGALALLGGSGLFGHKSTQEYGGTAMYSAATGAQTSTTHGAFGTGFGGVKADDQILDNVSGISKSIVDALDATAKTFGQTVGYEAAAGFASDFGDDATWGGLRIALGGKDIVNWNDDRQSKWAPKEFASGEEGYKQYLNTVAMGAKSVVLEMGIPEWSRQIVAATTDLESLSAALQRIGAQKALFDSWGQSMEMFKDISGDLQTRLLTASGSMEALSTNVGAFYQGFYSETERMATVQRQLRESLSGLGIGIDPAMGELAKQQFKATVEAAMQGGQAELAAQLMAMSQSFLTAADYAQKASDDSVKRLNEIMGQQHMLYADLAEAEGDYATAAQRRYWIETAGMNQAEQAAYDLVAAIRQQVSEAQALKQLSDARWTLENELLTAQGSLSEVARRQRERDLAEMTKGLDAEQAAKIAAAYDYNTALQKQIDAQRAANDAAAAQAQAAQQAADAAKQYLDAWQATTDGIFAEVRRIRGLDDANAAQSLSAAQTEFAIAQAQARAGDQDAAKRLPELSRAMLALAEGSATSLIELRRIQGQTAAALSDTGSLLAGRYGTTVPQGFQSYSTAPSEARMQTLPAPSMAPTPSLVMAAPVMRSDADPRELDLLTRILDVLDDIQHETRSTAINQADVAKAIQRVLNPSRSAFRVQQVPTA